MRPNLSLKMTMILLPVFISVSLSNKEEMCLNNQQLLVEANIESLAAEIANERLQKKNLDPAEREDSIGSLKTGKSLSKSKKKQSNLFKKRKKSKDALKQSIGCSFGPGRLGNQMSSFASLYAFEKVYGLRAYITRAQKTLFKNFFNFESLKKISVLEDEYASYKKLKWIAPFPLCEESVPECFSFNNYNDQTIWFNIRPGSFVDVGHFPNQLKTFKKYLPEIRDIFKIKTQYAQEAQERLQVITNQSRLLDKLQPNESITYVSIHVRRTDYGHYLSYWFEKNYVEMNYFSSAIQHYKDKFRNLIFFVVSDEPDWVKTNLESFENNIYFVGSVKQDFNDDQLMEDIEQRGIDLALLSQANHSILTYGTFGMWGALLCGGSAVMPTTHVDTIVSQEIKEANLPGWIFI